MIGRSLVALRIFATASPRDAPGARLTDKVTTGNCAWWLIVIGVGTLRNRANEPSGACAIGAAPVSAVLVPASAIVDAKLAEAEPT